MSLFGDIAGGILDVGGTALSYLVPGIGQPLGQALTNVGAGLLSHSMNQDSTAAAEAYNSPQNVMARYKSAGLNPNLIYTNGTTYSAPPTASVNFSPQTNQSRLDIVQQKAAVANTNASTDNTREAINTAKTQQFLNQSSTALNARKSNTMDFDLGLKSDLRDNSLEAADLSVQQQSADLLKTAAQTSNISESTQATLDADLRAELMKGVTLQQAVNNVLKTQQDTSTSAETAREIGARTLKIQNDINLSNMPSTQIGHDIGLGIILKALTGLVK